MKGEQILPRKVKGSAVERPRKYAL